jgi:CPA1 family monovalent cation:H+ antiporter
MALVLFSLLLQVQATGSITLADGIERFLVVIVGGSLIGLGLGYLSSGVIAQSEDPLTGILLTVALSLGAFQISEVIHVSGVVAVVIAGLIVGNIGLSRRVPASGRITLYSFWEYAGFGVNTFIFLLIGLEIDLSLLWQTLPVVLLAIAAYQIGRLLTVYPLLALVRWFDRPIPWRWQHVLFLGNIKGSLSMALALTLPASLANRADLIAIVYGAVLLSLVGQGLSLPWLVKRLKITSLSAPRQQVETLQAGLITAKAAQDELDSMLKTGILPKAIYEELRSRYQVQVARSETALRDLYNARSPQPEDDHKLDAVRRRLLLAEKSVLNDALRQRVLSETTVRSLLQAIDEQLLTLEE